MKFVPLFDEVTSALNFSTPDCRIMGGCELYTTKAAGSDKKLYRNIEKSLESQYEALLKHCVKVPPPDSELSTSNLSRASPFGPLSQISSRRAFTYLIATLNASHPDYDFSHILRPTDFRRERNLRAVINTIDSAVYNLRPDPGTVTLNSSSKYNSARNSGHSWSPQMWAAIDKEMLLSKCSVYCWLPQDEPFEGDESSIWSLHYFFFNKKLKRVTYVYMRAFAMMNNGKIVYGDDTSRYCESGYNSDSNNFYDQWPEDNPTDDSEGERSYETEDDESCGDQVEKRAK